MANSGEGNCVYASLCTALGIEETMSEEMRKLIAKLSNGNAERAKQILNGARGNSSAAFWS